MCMAVLLNGMVFGFARARLGGGCWWLLHHPWWENLGPLEGGLWSWSVWVARGGFPWKDSGRGGSWYWQGGGP